MVTWDFFFWVFFFFFLTKIGAEDFESWEEGFSLRRETEFRNQIDFQRTSLFIYMEAVFEGGREK